ncbi:MAG TPA: hypothetical protein EYH07_09475, partial [Kiloniellaceae bacterium]|nr:hypothetical protein [Kiloniellaceae bacterium]HIP78675.1 hypothetical protein [Kiloniellaceae bacterium]
MIAPKPGTPWVLIKLAATGCFALALMASPVTLTDDLQWTGKEVQAKNDKGGGKGGGRGGGGGKGGG